MKGLGLAVSNVISQVRGKKACLTTLARNMERLYLNVMFVNIYTPEHWTCLVTEKLLTIWMDTFVIYAA